MDPQFAAVIYPFIASLPRVAAVMTLLPLFGRRTTQGLIRAQFVVLLALFVYPSAVPEPGAALPVGFGAYVLIALKEVAIGLVLGLFLGTLYWVAENVGYLIDLQTGTHNALIHDPVNEHPEGPTAAFMLKLVLVLTMAGGGLLTLLGVLFDSCRVWPIFETMPRGNELFAQAIAARADSIFMLTVQFCAPFVILLLLIEIGLGLLNRISDRIDAYSLAMPIKSIVAFFVLLVFLSFVYDSLNGLLARDSDLLKLMAEVFR